MEAHDVKEDTFAPIQQAPAYLLVAKTIERKIVNGHILPGEAIGTESELARQLGVNRSTVREGLRCVEQAGLLERKAGRKFVVSLPNQRQLADRVSRALVLQQVTFREVAEATRLLETTATVLAAERRSKADLDAISDNIRRTKAAVNQPAVLADLQVEFHALIAIAARNRVLDLAREPSSLMIRIATRIIFENSEVAASRVIEAHEMILDALERRDVKDAELWIQRHVNDFVKGFERTGRSPDVPIQSLLELGLEEE